MNNLAESEVITPEVGRSYDIEAAIKDAKILYHLQSKAAKAATMVDEDIAEVQKELQMLMDRKKEILEPMENEMVRLKGNLMAYHRDLLSSGIDEKEIKLSHATLKSHRQPQSYEKDDNKLLSWVQDNATEYVKVANPTVAWGELKKQLVVVGGKVMLRDTGEIVEGVEPNPIETKFEVKVQ